MQRNPSPSMDHAPVSPTTGTGDAAQPVLNRAPVFRRGPIQAATDSAKDRATEERILEVRRWTDKLFSLRITRPASFRFEPGQFARLGVASGAGGIVWRAYSMASANYDEHLEFFSIVVPGGAFTTRLARLAPGGTIHLEKRPYGYLTTGRFVGGRDLWLLASGTGVAPFLSILRDPAVWQQYEHLVLAYSVRELADLAYRNEIAGLEGEELLAGQGGKLHFAPVVTRERVAGMLHRRLPALISDGELERSVGLALDPERARILVCGNPQMLEDVRDVLATRGLRPDRSREPGHFAGENYW